MKKFFSLIYAVCCFGVFVSCHNNPNDGDSTFTVDYHHDRLMHKSLDGDSVAFRELSSWLKLRNTYHRYFYETSIIANKYNFPEAYFLIFWSYVHPDPEEQLDWKDQLSSLDTKTRMLCLYNLLKANELGDEEAKYIIPNVFVGSSSVPSSNVYLDSLKNM